jgi:hypothetical protein
MPLKPLKLKGVRDGGSLTFSVGCEGYECSYNCPLFKIAGNTPPNSQVSTGSNKSADYLECAVVLVWAKFYGLC